MIAEDFYSLARILQIGLSSPLLTHIQFSHLIAPLHALARAKEWKSVFVLLDSMAEAGDINPAVAPNTRLLVSLANIAVNMNAYSQCLRFFNWMTKQSLEFGPHAYSVLLKGHGRAGNIVAVNAVLQQIVESRTPVDTVLLNTAVDALVRCDHVRTAHQLLLNQTYSTVVDVTTYNTVIKGYGAKGQVSQAFSLASRMQDSGLKIAPATVNTLMSACVTAADFDTAWDLLQMYTKPLPSRFSVLPALSRPSSPTPEVRQALLSSSNSTAVRDQKAGNTDASILASSAAQEKQMTSNRALSLRESLSVLSVWPEHQPGDISTNTKFEIDWVDQFRIAYTTLLSGLAESGHFDDVFALLKDMCDKGIPPNSITYASLISSCLKYGEVEKAKFIFKSIPTSSSELKDQSCDVHVYSALISGLCRLENEEHINTALALVEAITRDHYEADSSTLTATHVDKSESEVNDGFWRKSGDKVTVTVQMFNAIIEGFMRLRLLVRAEQVLRMMRRVRVFPNVASYTILMKGYADAGQYRDAKRIFRKLWQDKLKPDRVALNSFISICARSGDFEAGEKILSFMEERGGGVSPTVQSYIPLIRAYGRFGKEEQMWNAYKRMRNAGVPLNDFGIKVIVDFIMNEGPKQKHSLDRSDRLADRSGCLLRDGLDDGVSFATLRKCKSRLLSIFSDQQRRKYFGGLDSKELRSASETIFERHGWNDIDSRWRVL